MGTGILALMLGQLSGIVPIAKPFGIELWLINMLLFAVFSVAFIARITRYSGELRAVLEHPAESAFLGAVPMGLATIVNGFIAFGTSLMGPVAIRIALDLWVVDVVLSILSAFIVPMFMFAKQKLAFENMSAVWLLPIVPAEVAAASAGLIAPHVSQAIQQVLLVSGAILWALSVPAALAILTILFLRLAVHNLPNKELGVSGWLTLGPLGTGSLGLLLLGNAATSATAGTSFASLGPVLYGIGVAGGLIFWGYGLWWWSIGILVTLRHRRDLPFNMGWWAFTFPLGVFTAATYTLAHTLNSRFFLVAAVALTALLATLWTIVAARTFRHQLQRQHELRAVA